jgi:hypothetical protein
MTDNVTKLLLAAIALGLWANAAAHIVQPAKAQGSKMDLDKNLMDSVNNINTNLGNIDGRLAVFIKDLQLIMAGRCQNRQLCR